MSHRRAAVALFVAVLLLSVPLFAAQPARCGTKQPGTDEIAAIESGIAKGQKKKASAVIPVWFHVISRGAGFANGELSDTMIRNQIRVLNEAYNGRTGGANTGFGFELAGVTRTTNQVWFETAASDTSVELALKTALRRGTGNTLNVYTFDGGAYLGWAYFPSILTDRRYSNLDGVVLDWRTLPGGSFDIYSEGDTGTHEVGHWLSLYPRSTAPAARRATTSPIRRPSSARPSTARSAATVAPAPRSRDSTRSRTSWITPRTPACTSSPPASPPACKPPGQPSGSSG
jgi:hypothetical protein